MKLLIYIHGRVMVHGYRRQEFLWSKDHGGIYVYKNREFTPEEFNREAPEIFSRYHKKEMKPLCRVIDLDVAPAVADSPDLPPVEVVDQAQEPATMVTNEVAIERAVAVLNDLAPDRLKKKPGPKPAIAQ